MSFFQLYFTDFLEEPFLATTESGVLYTIDNRPDPPDAIIRAGEHTTWVEITTAYYSSQWAQDIYSFRNPDEDHVPMESPRTESGKHIGFCNMTKQFVNNFEKIVSNKLRKETYQQFTESYGRGTLLVGIEFPWFSGDTIDDMRKVWDARDPSRDTGAFDEMYIYYRHMGGLKFLEWTLYRES